MFFGEYEYRVDQKGRLPFPPRFREKFQQGVVLGRGIEQCITAYPLPEWQKFAEGQTSRPTSRERTRRLNRYTFSNAFNLELDRLGRVRLPPPLRHYAQIKEEAVIVGAGSYMEIWSKELWAQERLLMEQQAWQITESMEDKS